MKNFILICVILAVTSPAAAYWPTSPQNPMPIRVSSSFYSDMIEMCVELAGGRTLFVWNEGPIYVEDVYYQVVDKYGEKLFQEPIRINPESMTIRYDFDKLVSDGAGGAVIAFHDNIGPGCHIFLQRLDSLGNKLWGDTGRVVISELLNNNIACYGLQRDPINNNYFVIWIRGIAPNFSNPVVHKLDSEGYPIWPDAATVCDSSGANPSHNYHNCLAPDMSGGVYIVWTRNVPYQGYRHFLQHLDSNGNRLLQPFGNGQIIAVLGTAAGYYPEICSDGHGGAYISTFPDYYHTVMRVDGAGNTLFSTQVGGISSDNYLRQGDRDDVYVSGISTWSSSGYIRAQRLNSNGDMLWTQPYIQVFPFQTAENYAVCFNNGSLFLGGTTYSAYGQKISYAGEKLWDENGVLTMIYNYTLFCGSICTDSDEGMIMFMHTFLNPYDLYAQRVLSNGSLGGDLMAPEGLTAQVQGEDILLTWPDPGGVRYYNIYISPEPYSFPLSPDTTVTDTFFLHQGAVGDTVRFYQVTYER
ncbi:hypothetical protein ISS30_04740 [bacterium]|nr:hypothetical protein [bacterium]